MTTIKLKALTLVVFAFLCATVSYAQSLDLTFTYYDDAPTMYLPGTFNDWDTSADQLTVDPYGHLSIVKTLTVGTTYEYKFHYNNNWMTDPYNPNTVGQNNNSVITIASPMAFQFFPKEGTLLHQDDDMSIYVNVTSASNDALDMATSFVIFNTDTLSSFENFYDATLGKVVVPSDSTVKYLNTGSNVFRVHLQTESGSSVSESLNLSYLPEITVVDEVMPSGVRQGVNIIDDNTAIVALLAPYKEFVHLLGDFNGWAANEASQMKRYQVTEDSVYWWLELDNLQPDVQYAFQYLLDGEKKVADPYAYLYLDKFNDQYISDSVFPNIKAYPEQGDGVVSVFQTNKEEYVWKHEEYEKPAKEELVIYELLVRDFVEDHTFKSVKDSLSYLKKLGVNVIELMPVNEFGGNINWGYEPTSHFAVDKYYGTENDLKELIDEAHGMGMLVFMDVVLNHVYDRAPILNLYDWEFGDGQILVSEEHPYFNHISPNQTFKWGADFNHESSFTQAYVDSVNHYWLEEFKLDGFRFDFTKGMTNTPGDGQAYDAARIAILKRMADSIWEVNPDAIITLEHLAAASEEAVLANYGMLLWGNVNHASKEAIMGYHESSKSDLTAFHAASRGWSKLNLISYMESHDEERLMYSAKTYGNSFEDYNVQDVSTALERAKAMSALFFTMPGPKLMWMFGEIGYDFSIDYNGRTGEKPIRWSYLQNEDRLKLFNTNKEILRLRRSHPIFTSAETEVSLNLIPSFKTYYMELDGDYAYVAANLDVEERTVNLRMPFDGKYYDFFSGDSLMTTDSRYELTLQPGAFKILTTIPFERPEERGLVTSIDDEKELPNEDVLASNYPNPFNPTTAITYYFEAPQNGVTFEVFDISGKSVYKEILGNKVSGWHQVNFDGSKLSTGIYMYRISSANLSVTRKMTLIK